MHPPKVRYLVQHDLTLPEGPASILRYWEVLILKLISDCAPRQGQRIMKMAPTTEIKMTCTLQYPCTIQRELSYNVFSYKPNSVIDSSSI